MANALNVPHCALCNAAFESLEAAKKRFCGACCNFVCVKCDKKPKGKHKLEAHGERTFFMPNPLLGIMFVPGDEPIPGEEEYDKEGDEDPYGLFRGDDE